MIKLYPSFNNMVTKFNGVIEKHANIGNYPLVNKLTEYLFANSALASSNVIYTSYNEIKNLGKVMPLDYINSFISSQTSKSQRHKLLLRNNHIKEYDVLPWTKCFSLLNTGEKIYLPIQMLFTDYIHKNNKEEQYRGIASHSSYFKAMEKAILDNINVDAFTLTCFTNQKYKKVIFDNDRVLNILRKHKLLGDECDYEITPLYITQPDLQVPNFAVILKRKKQKSPYLLMSIEADLDPLEALLHGISDSISRAKSILKNTMFSSLYNNSLYWVMPHDIILKNKSVSELIGEEIKFSSIKTYHQQSNQKNVTYLINELKKISEYAIFLNVIPPKFRPENKCIVRVLIPELLNMRMINSTYINHPRANKFNTGINDYSYSIS